jgi:hypothetical protein
VSFEGPLSRLPSCRRDVYHMFGDPGSGQVDREWKRRNIVRTRIDGVNPFPCHRLAVPYFREAFARAFAADPLFEVVPKPGLRAWSFVHRHIRHDPSRPLSLHSWGIAIDIAPRLNRGRTFKRGKAPELWSADWMATWPHGLRRRVVEAFQSVGFTWGGDWDGDDTSTDHRYVDPMHFELSDRAGRAR